MISKEEYEKLIAMLERIEKAGTLAEFAKMASVHSYDDVAMWMPSVSSEDNFEKIHNEALLNCVACLEEIEKASGMVKYYTNYCRNLYESYKPDEKEIKYPAILKFIKDYEAYYHIGGEK